MKFLFSNESVFFIKRVLLITKGQFYLQFYFIDLLKLIDIRFILIFNFKQIITLYYKI